MLSLSERVNWGASVALSLATNGEPRKKTFAEAVALDRARCGARIIVRRKRGDALANVKSSTTHLNGVAAAASGGREVAGGSGVARSVSATGEKLQSAVYAR